MSVALYTSIVPGQVWRSHGLHGRKGELLRIRELKFYGGILHAVYDWQNGDHGLVRDLAQLRTWCSLELGTAFVKVRMKPMTRVEAFMRWAQSTGVPFVRQNDAYRSPFLAARYL